MTLIAFTANPKGADMVTDTLSYGPHATDLGQATKFVALPHLDAVLASQGESDFGLAAKMDALMYHQLGVATFDGLLEATPQHCRDAWAALSPTNPCTTFLLGFSESRQEFVGYTFWSDEDFQPRQAQGVTMIPTPWDMRPTEPEAERIRREGYASATGANNVTAAEVDQHVETWLSQPRAVEPRNAAQWRELAIHVRRARALTEPCRPLIGGRVLHTKLRRGGHVSTSVIHTFDGAGEETAQMLRGTLHPLGQLGPCPCGSGTAFLNCHLPVGLDLDELCPCMRSERTFRECHMVPPPEQRCGCGSGDPFAVCCFVPAVLQASERV